jgi:hypothetical protein
MQSQNQTTFAIILPPDKGAVANQDQVLQLLEKFKPKLDAANALTINSEADRAACDVHLGGKYGLKGICATFDAGRRAMKRTIDAKIDSMYALVLDPLSKAIKKLEDARSDWDDAKEAKRRKIQAEVDAIADKQRAELARRQKIQDAAVAQGKEARKEIPAPESIPDQLVPSALADNRAVTYYLTYEVVDINAMPVEFVTKVPNASAINERLRDVAKTFPKDRRGIDEPPQYPGMVVKWATKYTDR